MSDMTQREESFVTMMQALVRAAQKNHGVVTEDQMKKAFEGMELDDEQMQKVRDYLIANNIGIDEPLPLEDVLTEVEHNYLQDYEEMVNAIEQPDDGVFDAIKINAMAGQRDAQKQLAEYMLPKVVDIAKLYAGQGVYMEDLIGAGNEALVVGTGLLGPLEKPSEVEPDLARRIMAAMEGLIEENMTEGAKDQEAAELTNKVKDAADELADALMRKVTVLELAAEGDVTEEEILEAIRLSGNKIETIDYQAE